MTHKNTQTFHNICIDLNITYFIIPAQRVAVGI